MESFHFHLDFGLHTMFRLLESYDFETVLDIGSGEGEHSRFLRHFGKQVFSVDLAAGADYVGDFTKLVLDRQFDVVWCSHVLEHQRNVGLFLDKVSAALKDDGILAITLPVHPRARLLAGHITSWNAGLLCYNLILAGFDCSKAQILQRAELSLVMRKSPAIFAEAGDPAARHFSEQLERLASFFPFPISQGGNAEVLEANWGDREYELPPAAVPGKIVVSSKAADVNVP